MVPSTFVFLTALPLTINGKVDRKVLPVPDSVQSNDDDRYVAPRTPTEAAIAEIWAEILKVDRVGLHDSFFDLGGHSLIALRLVSQMEKRLSKRVPVAQLFKSPTIAQLASEIAPGTLEPSSPVIAVQPNGSKPPFFCIHGYNAYRHIARYLGPDQPFYGLGQHFSGRRVRGARLEDRAHDHVREIYAIQPRGPYYIAGHSFGGVIADEIAQQLQNDGHEIAFLGLIDTAFPKPRPNAWRRLRDRVIKPWRKLSRLEAVGWRYHIVHSLKVAVQWRLKAAQCYVYHLIGKSLPPDLLTFYVDEILFVRKYPREQSRYRPRPYDGQAHYFKASNSSGNVTSWKAMVKRGLVIHEIPGTHLTMIEDTGVRELARTLESCLEKAAVDRNRRVQSRWPSRWT